ncbi:hydrogenase formation protein HypD [Ectobacillus ponti]|uniref:Hydrogenase formation protein HypD n=1 Tax=Ectobacillus ponti TaxID=2961894 RepID=A0AA41XE04_9BACI|nr:hydrogenase formation protein HypD [Ectobacillus ponti]MCP8970366.1 hydrogenase formation protein HypD [Ectobacillus ponti]
MQEILKEFHSRPLSIEAAKRVREQAALFYSKFGRQPVLMEVCGSHTMSLTRSGLKQALVDHVQLISGPGCPVCVTDQASIDGMIALANRENTILCTFGDMMRVPGSSGSLLQAKTAGKDIRIVYSPLDSLTVARQHPDKEVVFLGIGFETTIPILALLLQQAEEQNMANFSIWTATKLVEPIIRHLLDSGEVQVDGFLLPGHVSIVLGEENYTFLREAYSKPGVITGFEPVEMAMGIYRLLSMLVSGEAAVGNEYKSVVGKKGNSAARQLMEAYFVPDAEAWRGIGLLPDSGLRIRDEYAEFDAKKKWGVAIPPPRKTKCRCGDIIRGLIAPPACPLYGKACTPMNPIGPCMVSGEGTCAAYYQYIREE